IQTIGRAARNVNGKVIMYADKLTPSMERAIAETYRRREIQQAHNQKHGVTPTSIKKDVREILEISSRESTDLKGKRLKQLNPREKAELIRQLTLEMKNAAKLLEFEHAAYLRDKIEAIKGEK
ncbi:MAG: UvrB/UvrC motif-containing protein, partial [Treponema sp.]|nr:UvrB/UvrC motif-containing protein [Treponema sp.]